MPVILLQSSKPGELKQHFLKSVERNKKCYYGFVWFCFVPFWKHVEGKTSPGLLRQHLDILSLEFFCRLLFSSCACVAAIHTNQTQSAEGVNCFVLTIVLLAAVFYNGFLRSALTHTMHI